MERRRANRIINSLENRIKQAETRVNIKDKRATYEQYLLIVLNSIYNQNPVTLLDEIMHLLIVNDKGLSVDELINKLDKPRTTIRARLSEGMKSNVLDKSGKKYFIYGNIKINDD